MVYQKVSAEDKEALVELVEEEVQAHQSGEVGTMSTNDGLAELLNVSKTSIINYLREGLSALDYKHRKDVTWSQTHSNNVPPEDKIALGNLVREEIAAHRDGRIRTLTSMKDLAGLIGLGENSCWKIIAKGLSADERAYRKGVLKGFPKEDVDTVVELVKEEIQAHKEGRLKEFTLNPELEELMGCKGNLYRYLGTIPGEDRAYRRREINSVASFKQIMKTHENEKRKMEKKKKTIAELVESEVVQHRIGEIEGFTPTTVLAERFGVSTKSVGKALNIIDQGDRKYRASVIHRDTVTDRNEKFGHPWSRMSSEQHKKRARKNYRAGYGLGGLTSKQLSENSKKCWRDPKHQEKMVEVRKKVVLILRRSHGYHVKGRFYSSSQQEGAVALLLEKYVPNLKIQEKENFQVRDKGISNGGLDFLLDGEFLEWHPSLLFHSGRGDIPSKEESRSYKKVLNSLSKSERKEFQDEYKKVLAINYRNERQRAVDESGYSGAVVRLVTTPQELYDFLSSHSDNLPSKAEFTGEFRNLVKYVKGFRVAKAPKSEAVEAAG